MTILYSWNCSLSNRGELGLPKQQATVLEVRRVFGGCRPTQELTPSRTIRKLINRLEGGQVQATPGRRNDTFV